MQRAAGRLPLSAFRFPLCLLLLIAGCATYQVGNQTLYPPHIRTVYVPIFESDSYRRFLGERLTEAVMKEIEAKTPYKVVGTPNADSVLTVRIVGDTKRVLVEDPYDNPREIEMAMQVEVRWIDRRGDMVGPMGPLPLPEELALVGATGTAIPEVGQSVTVAQQLAIQRLADQIVGMMESPW
jgi:hypothetical protein